MVANGEADHLVAERVWAEFHKALSETTPSAFIQVLRDCGALQVIFPEINALFGVPQPEQHHPEIDTGLHCLLALDQAAQLSTSAEVRLAALLHDLGKALTPIEKWPSHHGHEQLGLPVLENFCDRLRVPNQFKHLCLLVMRYHTHSHRVFELRPDTFVDMLLALAAFKPNNRVAEFLLACEADARGRYGFATRPYPQADFIREAINAAAIIDTTAILSKKLQGAEIGLELRRLRIAAIKNFKQSYPAATA
jgi:tRNA nucleotidyltransferase (CCA-adding enzyme)